jgi:hypothetical protein
MMNAPFMVGIVGQNVLTIPTGIVINLEDKTVDKVMAEDAQADVDVEVEECMDLTPTAAEAIMLAVAAASTPFNRIKCPFWNSQCRRKQVSREAQSSITLTRLVIPKPGLGILLKIRSPQQVLNLSVSND